MMIEFAAGICFLAAVVCAALWWRARAGWREAMAARDAAEMSRTAMASVLGALPVAGFRWRRDAAEEIAIGRPPGGGTGFSYAGFLAGIETEDAARIAAAVADLKQIGTVFTASVAAPGGAAYEVEGCRTASGDSVL